HDMRPRHPAHRPFTRECGRAAVEHEREWRDDEGREREREEVNTKGREGREVRTRGRRVSEGSNEGSGRATKAAGGRGGLWGRQERARAPPPPPRSRSSAQGPDRLIT